MGKPYSVDLRTRVVAAIETRGLSCNQAAKQFGIGISTAIGWMRLLRETGSVAPGKMGGHKPKAISGERVWLAQRVKDRDFTLRGLVVELAARGLKVDYCSVWEFVHAEKAQLQKKAWWLANAIVLTSRGGALSGASIKIASILSGWYSSTRPGPGPTWLHCGDGRHAAAGSPPRFHTAAGRP